jgi:ABC-type branched-subunit amino acid transport system substrate-binding protein
MYLMSTRILGYSFIFIFLFPIYVFSNDDLSEKELKGKQIYISGKGENPVFVYLSGPELKVPASQFPCIQCHKEKGVGAREGGVFVPDITNKILTSDHNGEQSTGRKHPPYSDSTLAQTIVSGLDPAGNELHSAMPRYILEESDLSNLIAYLRVLGKDPVPGVTAVSVQIGILLPSKGSLAKIGDEVSLLLSSLFKEMNANGGIYGREMVLKEIRLDPSQIISQDEISSIKEQLESVFCFISNLGLPQESPVLSYLAEKNIPSIFPLMITPKTSPLIPSSILYLHAGLADQGRVLVDFQINGLPSSPKKAGLLYANDAYAEDGASGIKNQLAKNTLSLATELSYTRKTFNPIKWVTNFKETGIDILYFFGPGKDARALIEEATKQKWHPTFLSSIDLAGTALFSLLGGKETVAKIYLTAPSFYSPPSHVQENKFRGFLNNLNIEKGHLSFKRSAYASALFLTEGLKLAGYEITQNHFLNGLNRIWKWESGVTPHLTYNENRRVGATGSSILELDLKNRKFTVTQPWKEPQ